MREGMGNWWTGIAMAGTLLALAACATEPRPELKVPLPDKAAADLNIARDQIHESGTCQYARVPPGVTESHFYRGWFVATDSTLKLLDWDEPHGRFIVAVSQDFSALHGAALHAQMLGTQLQLQGPNTWLVVSSENPLSGAGALSSLHKRMLAAGVKDAASPGWVGGSERSPTTVTIPIYIPAR